MNGKFDLEMTLKTEKGAYAYFRDDVVPNFKIKLKFRDERSSKQILDQDYISSNSGTKIAFS